MDKNLCSNFLLVKAKFPDELSNGEYQFIDEYFKKYCTSGCNDPIAKINAGCLYFFDEFFGTSELFKSVAKSNTNIVDYIIIWLSYMLNLKENTNSNISHLKHFYDTTINNDKYTNPIDNVSEYKNYKDLIDKKHDLTNNDMNKNIISKLYEAFNILCNMYTEFDESKPNCEKILEKANKFVEKYKELDGNCNITGKSSCSKILFTLSSDYINFKNKCNDIPPLPGIASEIFAQRLGFTSSSSIATKLFIVLSIFGAIGFFFGISYKYSLFGFRKRFKKQQIREKIKNIKKKMNQ
ncbi:PIR protein [Plasmodium yoelii]|uniref:PIR protein n=2 Tax=Plasmodium yoelii TaxID=5861 RepID=A0AAE9WJP7_PLAYO|nr:PIR protein [Plasmodium yoelii]WBY54895.1 PIR protein [Plasmodium yoelii yoelii]CDS44889.1 YIR protein [Plasmodium yoelii]VTZ71936.1 PIR protein [Plasmodium yoelii]|eukprot:XP_022811312.1 PIR protein [Plasmodium yoelii]